MKKLILFSTISFVLTTAAFGADLFDEFKNKITGTAENIAQANLNNFTRDLGGLINGGSMRQGENLGIPGFDVGIHVPYRKVSEDDTIVKAANVDSILLPILQAEVGLPANIDLLGRYSAYANATLVGFGVRYNLYKGFLPGIPSISLQGMYNTLDVKANENRFKATGYNVSAVASFGLPIVNPYIGFGYDSTSLEPDSSITNLKGTASGTRIEAGINLGLLPFTYLQLGGMMTGNDIGYTAGLGVKF